MSKEFSGKLAFVTGGVTGIGHDICKQLAEQGATVVIADLSADSAQKVADSLPSDGGRKHLGVGMDVSKKAQVDAGVERVLSTFGRPPQLIVNCAGIDKGAAPLLDLKEEDVDLVMGVNYKGTLFVCQALGRAIMAAGQTASFVNIGSVLSIHPMEKLAHYCASKAAVMQLTQVAAREWGPKGIRVNTVHPGLIETPLTANTFWAGIKDRYIENSSLRRLGKTEDVTSAVLFLLSDKSGFITGEGIEVSGQRFY